MSSEVTRMSSNNGSGSGNNNNSNSSNGFNNSNAQTGISEDPNSANNDVKPVSIFSTDYKKHDDLKQMLDSNKDNLKLDAMKRIIGMIAKGKNASDLFPAVVKNVVSKNVEIKKLVYVYLMRYAEEQQDLALLSISTFQRALKDPNQLIRASALRVLSSIRVPIIVTIMLLAIKEAVSDMSPYVRKTAANAITKLYCLEPDLKDDLVAIIEKLLADKTILVAGSAIQAFEEVCPERIDLIHKNYRKLCNLLIDVDEWGQVTIINMLARYARTQFCNPHTASESNNNINKQQQEDTLEEEDEDPENEDFDAKFNIDGRSKVLMDPDHRLLLKVTKPLLQSRNSAVVLSVAQLYYYVAPKSEVQFVTRALVRLLRSYREVQIIVLKNIVSMAQKNQQMFQAHQKSFYVHSNDSIQVKILKLEILTCLANETNISIILREFQAYVLSQDKDFAAATIHAIGRCASSIKEVADNCLTGLVNLMSRKDETIVAESVVVIKRLLQLNPTKNGHIITKMAKMTDKVTVPMARASILWLIGEYSDRVNKIAPDVLRKTAKTFCEEENIVKLQILNLAVKLYLTNQKQVALLVQYVFNLAKYDQSYDIRDRARFLRTLLFNNEKCPNLSKHLKKILLAPKPAPVLQSSYKDSDQFQLGTLSHAISARVNGYSDLPSFPEVAPDPSVRNVEIIPDTPKSEKRNETTSKSSKTKKEQKKKQSEKFYSDEEEDDDQKSISTEGADPTDDEENDDDDEEEEEDENKSDASNKSDDENEEDEKVKEKTVKKRVTSESESEEEEESEEDETSSSESDTKEKAKVSPAHKPKQPEAAKPSPVHKPKLAIEVSKKTNDSESESSSSSDEDSDESSSSSSESDEPEIKKPPVKAKALPVKQEKTPPSKKTSKQTKPEPIKEVNLLDLDFGEPIISNNSEPNKNTLSMSAVPVLSPSLAADLANLSSSTSMTFNLNQTTNHVSKKEYELLNKINGNGLQIQYKFPRVPNKFSNKMITIELIFSNWSNGDFSSFTITNKRLQSGMSMSEFNEIDVYKNATVPQQIGIDFNDTTQSAFFELSAIFSNDPTLGGTSAFKKWSNLSITCPIGELLMPGWNISENEFNKLQAKLKGMNEISASIDELTHAKFLSSNLNTKLLENFYMCQIPSSQQDIIKYASLTTSSKLPILLSLFFSNGTNKCQINVNCEKIVLANMFIKEIKQLLNA